jgi:hypothetical protein
MGFGCGVFGEEFVGFGGVEEVSEVVGVLFELICHIFVLFDRFKLLLHLLHCLVFLVELGFEVMDLLLIEFYLSL